MPAALTAVTRALAVYRYRMLLCFASLNSRRQAMTSIMPSRPDQRLIWPAGEAEVIP
jgi:hypothetical protein